MLYSTPYPMDFTRLLAGLAIALFHTQLADFVRKQDRALVDSLRERGVPAPEGLSKEASHDVFFLLGIVIALCSLARIWLTLR